MSNPTSDRELQLPDRSGHYVRRPKRTWADRDAAKNSRDEIHTMVALFVIVCLLVLNLIVHFPALGALIARYNAF